MAREHDLIPKDNAYTELCLDCFEITSPKPEDLIRYNMGVPFESLLPYAICVAFFGITGAGLSKIRNMQNGGKRHRWSVDQWDRQMMDRDRRLTGFLRGQTDNPKAPEGFELSNPWRIEKGIS